MRTRTLLSLAAVWITAASAFVWEWRGPEPVATERIHDTARARNHELPQASQARNPEIGEALASSPRPAARSRDRHEALAAHPRERPDLSKVSFPRPEERAVLSLDRVPAVLARAGEEEETGGMPGTVSWEIAEAAERFAERVAEAAELADDEDFASEWEAAMLDADRWFRQRYGHRAWVERQIRARHDSRIVE